MLTPLGLTLLLIGAYFVAMVLIGYWSGRKESDQGYILADRKVGTARSTASMFAILGGETLVVQAALAYVYGFASMWYWVGLSLGTLALGLAAQKIKAL